MAAPATRRAAERDPGDRLSADDEATRTEAQFFDRAMEIHAARAAAAPKGKPGVCTNCRQACLPLAVYCDEECRGDHEARERRGR